VSLAVREALSATRRSLRPRLIVRTKLAHVTTRCWVALGSVARYRDRVREEIDSKIDEIVVAAEAKRYGRAWTAETLYLVLYAEGWGSVARAMLNARSAWLRRSGRGEWSHELSRAASDQIYAAACARLAPSATVGIAGLARILAASAAHDDGREADATRRT